jgi:hypothetical protein
VWGHAPWVPASHRRHDDARAEQYLGRDEVGPPLFIVGGARSGTSVGRVLRWRRTHDDVLVIRYDAFTQSPEATFGRVRIPRRAVEPEAVREKHPDPGRWRGDPFLWNEIMPVTKDWRDVTLDEAAAIQNQLAHVMANLGYERYATDVR